MSTLINRRQFIKMASIVTATTALTACDPNTLLNPTFEVNKWPLAMTSAEWRLLNRVTFGPRIQEREQVAKAGLAAFIENQLAPETLPEMDLTLRLALRRLETLYLDAPDLFDVEDDVAKRELQQATVLRATYSHRQLYEVMVDFWSNHFHIDQNKGYCAWLKTVDDREVIRPHALGNFYDLLYASAHSSAMLFYLDNQENHVKHPNENYARELLELHTLGVDSSYTQTDVQELARCLTGWTIKKRFYRGQITFNENRHDDGPKEVFGLTIPAGAKEHGLDRVIEMLATHPDTAHFIATKLVRRFIADDPPPALIARAAQTFLQTQGDITATLRTILLAPEVLPTNTDERRAPQTLQPKLKRPFEYIVSTLRQLNAQTNGSEAILKALAQMGQPLFQWPTPDGFPDQSEFWQSSLFTRWRFALTLAQNNLSGTELDLKQLVNLSGGDTSRLNLLNQFSIALFGQPLPETIAKQLLSASDDNSIVLAALLGSPTFQWR